MNTAYKMPEQVQNNQILKKKVWEPIHKYDQNYVGAMVGEVGQGKSWAALRFCEVMDPNFTIDQVAFTPEEFMRLVKSNEYGRGSFILFDEAGVGISNRDWYSEVNKQVGFILDLWRHQNRGAIFTLPSLGGLDKRAKARLRGYMSMQGINHQEGWSLAKYYNLIEKPYSGKLLRKFPQLREPEKGTVETKKYLKFGKPSKELRKAYEEKAAKFKEQKAEEGYQKVVEANTEDTETPATELAEKIIEDDELFDRFKKKNHSQKYLDKSSVHNYFEKQGYEMTGRKAKRVKSAVYETLGLDEKDEWV